MALTAAARGSAVVVCGVGTAGGAHRSRRVGGGAEDRLEVGTELRGLMQGPSPPFFLEPAAGFGRVVGLRRAWEVGWGLRPGEATAAGEGVGVGVTKGCAGGAGGGMLLLTAAPGRALELASQ